MKRILIAFSTVSFALCFFALVVSWASSPPSSMVTDMGMKFILITPGTFMMGSPSDESGSCYYKGEKQHKVTISKPFYLQATEVTQGQWKAVMGNNPSEFKDCGDDGPVESVSWDEVQEFIRKLNRHEGTDRYRLPTEAEWEYACRGGSTTSFCWVDGDEDVSLSQFGPITVASTSKLGEYAWYNENSQKSVHPVGQKKPNDWELYDMHGNVCEWCQDWKEVYPDGHVIDPIGPPKGSYRVFRGGSWAASGEGCRSASRDYDTPDYRSNDLGFRLARTP